MELFSLLRFTFIHYNKLQLLVPDTLTHPKSPKNRLVEDTNKNKERSMCSLFPYLSGRVLEKPRSLNKLKPVHAPCRGTEHTLTKSFQTPMFKFSRFNQV